MLADFTFFEPTPATPSTAISSQYVANAANYLPRGVAGPFDDFRAINVIFDLPANTTGGTLDVVLQTSPGDSGATWYDTIRIPTIANGAPARSFMSPLSLATTTTTTVQVGKNATPLLAPNTVVNGAFGDRARLVMTAGAGAASSITITVKLLGQRPREREHGGR